MKTTLLTTTLTVFFLSFSFSIFAQDSNADFADMSAKQVELTQDEGPVYNGPTGCNRPLNEGQFVDHIKHLNNQPFEKDKLAKAKEIAEMYCLKSMQVKQIMLHLSFEEHRLEFARFAYQHTYDLNNYHEVESAFKFTASAQKLKASID